MVNKRLTRGRSCWRNETVLSGAERREAARGQETSASQDKKTGLATGLYLNPSNTFRRLRPPRQWRHHRHRHQSASSGFGRLRLSAQRGLLARFDPGPLAICFAPEAPQVGAASRRENGPRPPPCRPLPIALPQIERWPAQIQTGKPRQVPLENRSPALRQACPANADGWNGLQAQTSPPQERDCGMENFLLFVLSSSFCTLVASVTLLLWPLLAVH